jgi:hypothetical protein
MAFAFMAELPPRLGLFKNPAFLWMQSRYHRRAGDARQNSSQKKGEVSANKEDQNRPSSARHGAVWVAERYEQWTPGKSC